MQIHIVNRDMMNFAEDEGVGLGIVRASERNLAMLGGLAWRSRLEDPPLTRIIRHKYDWVTDIVGTKYFIR